MGYFRNLMHMTLQTESSYSDKKGNIERQVMAIHEPELTDKQTIGKKIHVITKSRITLPLHHISTVPLTSINYPNKTHTDTLL